MKLAIDVPLKFLDKTNRWKYYFWEHWKFINKF